MRSFLLFTHNFHHQTYTNNADAHMKHLIKAFQPDLIITSLRSCSLLSFSFAAVVVVTCSSHRLFHTFQPHPWHQRIHCVFCIRTDSLTLFQKKKLKKPHIHSTAQQKSMPPQHYTLYVKCEPLSSAQYVSLALYLHIIHTDCSYRNS